MRLIGTDKKDHPKEVNFDLVARHGEGLYIPSMPAILMAKKLANDEVKETGACPCVGFVTLDDYLSGLSEFEISWKVS